RSSSLSAIFGSSGADVLPAVVFDPAVFLIAIPHFPRRKPVAGPLGCESIVVGVAEQPRVRHNAGYADPRVMGDPSGLASGGLFECVSVAARCCCWSRAKKWVSIWSTCWPG